MTRFPYTHLVEQNGRTIAVTGRHIIFIDSKTGEILSSNLEASDEDLHSGPIRFIAASQENTRLATSADDKLLKIWDTSDLSLVNSRELPKKATEILFTADGSTVIVADKFGDVFSYVVEPTALPEVRAKYQPPNSKRGSLASHSNHSGGTLILGHTSIITRALLTPSNDLIITADRDEHIRVSHYPNGWDIERYCLGHTKYVSALHIPSISPGVLISGGGDHTLRFWDFMRGRTQGEVEVWSAVQPYLRVSGDRPDFVRLPAEKGGGWVKKSGKGKLRGGGRKRGRASNLDEGQEEESRGDEESGTASTEPPLKAEILVISKLGTYRTNEREYLLIFSVTGATALFYTTYPTSFPFEPPPIAVFDFGFPVLDFVTVPDGILVSVDVEYDLGADGAARDGLGLERPRMRRLIWSSMSGKFGEDILLHPLLETLNSMAGSATPAELLALDLYAALTLLPKNEAAEADEFSGDLPTEGAGEEGGDASSAKFKARKKLQAKLQGRLAETERKEENLLEGPEVKKPRLAQD